MSGIFNDSKTFVDMPLKEDVETVLAAYHSILPNPTNLQIIQFIDAYFAPPGSDLSAWIPNDWKENPKLINKINDSKLQSWAKQINQIWLQLGKQIDSDVYENPERHSIIGVPHPFVVPGGRFREFYYWDSYWIINGLLLCDMDSTALNLIENILYLIDNYHFMPNGARVYYDHRTQPPFATQMVFSYFHFLLFNNSVDSIELMNLRSHIERIHLLMKEEDHHHHRDQNSKEEFRRWESDELNSALEFIERVIPILDKEYDFWMANRSIEIKDDNQNVHTLNRFQAQSNLPRPEGYSEDYETAVSAGISDPLCANEIYQELASGAETGWDFSSRWFADQQTLNTINVTEIVPLDLNSILFKNEITMSFFYSFLANSTLNSTLVHYYDDLSSFYKQQAEKRLLAFESIFWNNEAGIWVDFNLTSNSQQSSDYFYASFLSPLWAELYWNDITQSSPSNYTSNDITSKVQTYIENNFFIFSYPGGLPTSLIQSGQQWDFPNGWSPLNLIAIRGMQHLGDQGSQWAKELAHNWIQNNYNGFQDTQYMFEKYNVTNTDGIPGDGGEYNVQTGFGWTNGVALEVISLYCTQPGVDCLNTY